MTDYLAQCEPRSRFAFRFRIMLVLIASMIFYAITLFLLPWSFPLGQENCKTISIVVSVYVFFFLHDKLEQFYYHNKDAEKWWAELVSLLHYTSDTKIEKHLEKRHG